MRNGQPEACLSDLGLANTLLTSFPTMIGGTSRYMAPELFVEKPVTTTESDIYSFGMTYYEVILVTRRLFKADCNAYRSCQDAVRTTKRLIIS